MRRDYAFPGHEPSFSILSDKARYAPWGLFGGDAARPAKYILNPETPGARELPSKITFQLAPDDIVSVQTPGGGGTRSPLERPAEDVARDVAQGKISAERARATGFFTVIRRAGNSFTLVPYNVEYQGELAQAGAFAEGMSAGRGFLAISIVALGRWRPGGVALASLVFGAAMALQFVVQALGWSIRYELVLMIPYVLTLIALGAFGRGSSPAMLGRPLTDD